MRKGLILCAVAAFVAAGCGKAPLAKGNWEKLNRERLNEIIIGNGSSSDSYSPQQRPYAVFDFDNTTIIGDIAVATMVYQLENLRMRMSPEEIWTALTDLFPNIDAPVEGRPGVSVRMLATDIANDYAFLYERYISGAEMKLEEIRKTPEFLDFRAKTYALSAASDALGYETGCLWIIRLHNGMTRDEVRALAADAAEAEFARKRISREVWESPDMGEAGRVKVEVMRGLGLSDEMRNLYKALKNNGIDTYICSASMKEIVEAVACDPKYGLDVPAENVFGIMLKGGGIIRAAYDPNWEPTFKEGKVKCIRQNILRKHGGAEPLIVAGDSNGDYNMLTEFRNLKAGLIIDCGGSGAIAELSQQALATKEEEVSGTRYLLQGRDLAKKKFIKKNISKNKL